MDTIGTGVITKLADGRWDNQYDVEITLVDGTKLDGFDGIQVYEKKKDGTSSKVWPLVQESKFKGVPFTWSGNIKASQTKAGEKLYATITFAEQAGDGAVTDHPPQGESGRTAPPPATGPTPSPSTSWGPPPTADWGQAPSGSADPRDDYWAKRAEKDEQTTREIEAAWAIGVLLAHVPGDKLHQEAHRLIVLKHQIARELAE